MKIIHISKDNLVSLIQEKKQQIEEWYVSGYLAMDVSSWYASVGLQSYAKCWSRWDVSVLY